MKILIGLATALVILGATKGLKLDLEAPHMVFLPISDPRSGFRLTVTVRVTAELEGEPDDPEKYYCLDEEWDWGDDRNPSLHEVDCDPFEPGMEITRRFSSSNQYKYPGTYTIRLRLKNGRKTVISGTAKVQVRGG
ncbi:MAG: PKD domain-containing protein [Vicinamibacteria bacterium]